jgi:hypothetical protein
MQRGTLCTKGIKTFVGKIADNQSTLSRGGRGKLHSQDFITSHNATPEYGFEGSIRYQHHAYGNVRYGQVCVISLMKINLFLSGVNA